MDARLVLMAAVLFLAGCATPPVPVAPETPAPATTAVLATHTGCFSFCEPNLAIDGRGRIFVLGDALGVSADGGKTFANVSQPPLVPPQQFHSDGLVQASPDGALYYSSLMLGCAPSLNGCSTFLLYGIQVARSDDGGTTWGQQTAVRFPEPQAVGADRQWLAFGEGGVVCLTYQRYGPALVYGLPTGRIVAQVDDNVVAGCSSDKGATFPTMTTVLPPGHTNPLLIGGPPLIDSSGRLLILYFLEDGLHLAVSADLAKTFTTTSLGFAGDFFPGIVEVNGSLVAAWRAGDGGVALSRSLDGGLTWGSPEGLTPSGVTTANSPWIAGDARHLFIAWTAHAGNGTNDLVLWTDGTSHTLASGLKDDPSERGATDFTHFALTAGRPLVVFADLAARDTDIVSPL